jgi:hypothetical protein
MNTTNPNVRTPLQPEPVPSGVETLNEKDYMRDGAGSLVPLSLVKPVDKLIDETVRGMMGYAAELSAQIARFKGHCFDDVTSLQELIAAEYGATVGGKKGNITLTSYDGRFKVTVQVQDQITFGPELQVAKQLVDECIGSWSEGSNDKIRALVNHAFQVDKEGQINRAALFALRRIAIEDPRWKSAMDALTDSIRTMGSATYVRFYRRRDAQAAWEPVTIDLAAA